MIFTSEFQINIPEVDILTFLFQNTRFKDDDQMWINADNPELYVTLRRTKDLVGQIGHGLRSLGIGQNHGNEDIVLSFVENQIMVAPFLFSVLCAGGIHATCPVTATAFELARQIRLTKPKVLVCSPRTRNTATDAIGKSTIDGIKLLVMESDILDVHTATGQSIISKRHLQWQRIDDRALLESTTACLVYSSGTTGVPKGVRMTHANIVSNLCQMAFHFDYFSKKAIAEGTFLRAPAILQNATVLGITVQSMQALQAGMQVYQVGKFEFPRLRYYIREYQLSAFFLVPSLWNRIANEYTKEDLATFRFALSGASPLPLPVQLRIQEMLPKGVVLRVQWGMTETTTAASQPKPTERDEQGSVGRLLPNLQAIILSPDGKELGFDMPGELCIKGPNITREYFKDPVHTRNAFTPDGWFRTGDIGYFSKEGKLFIVGRSKASELLKYKGHQISPAELEGILGQCPGVEDIGIIGVPDGDGNDLPRAYVVASRIGSSYVVSEKDVYDFLKPRVSGYKQLRGGVVFVKEIPRNLNGKILRNVLKEWSEKSDSEDLRARL